MSTSIHTIDGDVKFGFKKKCPMAKSVKQLISVSEDVPGQFTCKCEKYENMQIPSNNCNGIT